MKIITSMLIQSFKNYLREEEKSKATIEKYIRDIMALMVYNAFLRLFVLRTVI